MSSVTHEITLRAYAGEKNEKITAEASSYGYHPEARLVEFHSGQRIVLAVGVDEIVSIRRIETETETAPEGAPPGVAAAKPAGVTPADLAFRRPIRDEPQA